jgi:hypothetical protein
MSKDEPSYQLVADFQIDNNELEGLSPQEIFSLGVEFGYAIIYARQDAAYNQNVQLKNIQRIEALLWRHGRRYEVAHTIDDQRVKFIVQQKR